MDTAILDDRGVRLLMVSREAAIFFRMRCHQARKIDRDKNTETFTLGDPLYGVSVYDQLVIRDPFEDGDGFWLVMEKNNVIPGLIVSLSTGETVQATLPTVIPESRQLEPPPDVGEMFDRLTSSPLSATEIEEKIGEVIPPKPMNRRA